jgi:ribonuclease Z
MSEFDGLQVFMCGTSSPLPAPGRAQACVAVLAGKALYVIDAGAGSAQVATLGGLPLERLEAVFLTHFHSDHIAAVPEFNLNSWVAGRPRPLSVVGPAGVAEVVDGLNAAYRLDRTYRVAHHGAELMSPEVGVMQSNLMEAGTALSFGDLTVTSFEVNHDPIRPAVAYRFDYRGRSVVISGDTIVNQGLLNAAKDADLLLQDALSLPIVQTLERASAGSRMEKILHDIQDYHAHAGDLAALVDQSGVRQLALYHLVPPPSNALFEKIFSRDLPEARKYGWSPPESGRDRDLANLDGHVVDDALRRNAIQQLHGMREFDKVYQRRLHPLILSQNDPFSYVTKYRHHSQN